MFIAFEGIDGSGKTTLTRLITEKLREMGHRVHQTREPTDRFRITKEESSRHDVQTAIELFFRFTEDRFFHQKSIEESMKRDEIVVSDRYIASSMAYQGALIEPVFGNTEETLEWMKQVSRIIRIRPDLTVYLDVDPEISLRRIRNRREFSGFENLDYLKKVREYYGMVLDENTIILDSSRTIRGLLDETLEKILERMS